MAYSQAAVRAFTQSVQNDAAQDIRALPLPALAAGRNLDVDVIRDDRENFYLGFVWAANVVAVIALAIIGYFDLKLLAFIALYGALLALFMWINWKLTFALLHGHGVEVGPNQYPQIYRVVKSAADILDVQVPTVIILQGHGVFELFVAKRFTRRGLIVMTSNMLDEFVQRPSSREFMMFIGRQLGHIKAGHFRLWFFKDVIGLLALFFHQAWWRRCHLTADRLGLLVAGEFNAAEQALCIITVGARSAPGINIDEIIEQRTRLFESVWSWLQLAISTYPYMVDRITRLRQFALELGMNPTPNVGVIPIQHGFLQPIPLLVIHGHDRLALLELKDYLQTQFPQIAPRLMVAEAPGSLSLPEKFEHIASDVRGAIAILTPDDIAGAADSRTVQRQFRARQNVVVEVGWIWGRLGRHRCLVLMRGSLELPSDLAGIDCHPFRQSPRECAEVVQSFVTFLEREMQMGTAAAQPWLSSRQKPEKSGVESGAKSVQLHCLTGEFSGQIMEVQEAGIIIGRDPHQANLVLSSSAVSAVHVRVWTDKTGRGLMIEDLASTNGTYFVESSRSGEKPQWAELRGSKLLASGAKFRLGDDAAVFEII